MEIHRLGSMNAKNVVLIHSEDVGIVCHRIRENFDLQVTLDEGQGIAKVSRNVRTKFNDNPRNSC